MSKPSNSFTKAINALVRTDKNPAGKLSVDELGKKASLSRTAIYSYLAGKTTPDLFILERIASAFRVPALSMLVAAGEELSHESFPEEDCLSRLRESLTRAQVFHQAAERNLSPESLAAIERDAKLSLASSKSTAG